MYLAFENSQGELSFHEKARAKARFEWNIIPPENSQKPTLTYTQGGK